MSKTIICIACPFGCRLEVSEDLKVLGSKCRKGKEYAVMEVTHPTRVLTTSVRVSGGDLPLVSVRSNAGIPKARIREAVSLLKQMSLQAPVSLAQVIVKNVLGTEADIVATRCVLSVVSAPVEKSQEVED